MMTSSNGNIFRIIGPLCGELTSEFPSRRPVTWSFDAFFDLRLNKQLRTQLGGWWFETPLHPLWRHCNAMTGTWFFHVMACRLSSTDSLQNCNHFVLTMPVCICWKFIGLHDYRYFVTSWHDEYIHIHKKNNVKYPALNICWISYCGTYSRCIVKPPI